MSSRFSNARKASANLISPLVYASGAAPRALLVDSLHSMRRRLPPARTWSEVSGQINLDELFLPVFDPTLAEDRSHNGSGTSYGYLLDAVPSAVWQVVKDHSSSIEGYLGRGFAASAAYVFRNYRLPAELRGFDVYSNVWHQDTMEGNRLLKLFVLLQDVSEDDGPLEYVPAKHSASVFHGSFGQRYDIETMGKDRTMPEHRKLIGPKGTYALVNTSVSLHRAGVPKGSRDMLQVTLRPSWRSNNS
jgi:hypothetical protein